MSSLDSTVEALGDGGVTEIPSAKPLFKLDSYEENPIVRPEEYGLTWYEDGQLRTGAIFNGGAELFQNEVILTPRCHRNYKTGRFFDARIGTERHCLENYISEIWPLSSRDGIRFERVRDVAIRGDGTDHKDFVYGIEDIRIVRCGEIYVLIGCGKVKPAFKGENADRIAIYSTDDFVKISYHGMVTSFDSRNAVPFSDLAGDKLYILLRFYPNIHLDLLQAGLDQLLEPIRHMDKWQELYERRSQTVLLQCGAYRHEKEKIGPGTQIIRTDRGWLLLYHAVGEIDIDICRAYGLSERIERGYSICAAILDLDDPRKVICRSDNPVYIPSAAYELYGSEKYPVDVPAVVFPMGSVVRKDKLLLYAGAGDKYVILLSCSLSNLVDYLFENCRLPQCRF